MTLSVTPLRRGGREARRAIRTARNIEMRLDDMDAKLDQILKQSKAKAPNARAASGKKR